MRKNRNKSGKIITAVLAATMAFGLLTGCGDAGNDTTQKTKGTTEVTTAATTEAATEASTEGTTAATEETKDTESSTEEKTEEASTEAASTEAEKTSETVSSLPGDYPMSLTYCSGAGGWSTVLTLSQDGSFTGTFSDSEMGESDENDYPNGTIYECNFSGQFSDIKKVNEYTYSMVLDSVSIDEEADRIEDGVRYKAGEPSGMDSGTEIYFYTPDTPISELSEEFLSWKQTDTDKAGTLDCYAIYNKSADSGFFQYTE